MLQLYYIFGIFKNINSPYGPGGNLHPELIFRDASRKNMNDLSVIEPSGQETSGASGSGGE